MVTAIDKRVVQMEFDNKQFESGVKTSLSTLEQLKDALNMEGVGKGLDDISKSVGAIDLTNINSNLQALSNRFSTWGIVGMTAIQNITSGVMELGSKMVSSLVHNPVFDQIKSGGISRALNLEDANFKLRNILGSAEAAAEVISGPVNDAVSGTAFGLDEAAKVASQLTTSGIQDLDELGYHLRTISDVAAMAGSSYSEIGYIFTKVAAKGKVQGSELAMLTERGIAAYDALAHYLNISVEDVQEAMKKGLIDFETFSAALANEFGGSAAKANDTFTGALANMRAALSRIGAKVATPALEDLRDVFNALRVSINGVNAQLDPLIGGNGVLIKRMRQVADFVVKKVSLSETQLEKVGKVVQNVADLFDATFDNVLAIADPLITVFKAFVPDDLIDRVITFTSKLASMAQNFTLTESELAALKTVFSVFFGVIRLGITVVSNFLGIIGAIIDLILDLVVAILDLVSSEEAAKNIADGFNKAIETTNKIGRKVIDFFEKAGEKIKSFVDYLKRLRDELKKMPQVKRLIDDVKDVIAVIQSAIDTVTKFVSGLFLGGAIDLETIFSNPQGLAKAINDVIGDIYDFVDKVKAKLEEIKSYLNDHLPEGFSGISAIFGDLAGKIGDLGQKIKDGNFEAVISFIDKLKDQLPSLEEIKTFFVNAKKDIGDFVAKTLDLLSGKFGDSKQTFSNAKEAVSSIGKGFIEGLQSIDWDMIFDVAKKGSIAWIIYNVGMLIRSLRKGLESVSDIPSSFSTALKGLGKAADEYAKAKKFDAFYNIAKAILAVAVAILLLSKVPADRLEDVTQSVLSIILAISTVILAIGYLSDSKMKLDLTNISNAADQIKASLAHFASNVSDGVKSFLKKIGNAAIIIAIVVAIVAIIGAVTFLSSQLKDTDQKASIDAAFLRIAAIVGGLVIAILAISAAEKFLSGISIGTVLGIVAIANAIVKIALVAALIAQVPNLDKGLNALVPIASIITIMMGLLMLFTHLYSKVGKNSVGSLLGVVLGMVLVVAAINLLLPSIIVLSALGKRGSDATESIRAIFISLGIAMALIGKFSSAEKTLAFAASITILAVGLLLIAEAVNLLADPKAFEGMKNAGRIIVALSVLMVVLGALSELALPGAGVLALLGAAFLLAGAGVALFGAGVNLVANAVKVLSESLQPLIDSIVYFAEQLIENADTIREAFTILLTAGLQAILALQAPIAMAVVGIIFEIIKALNEMSPQLLDEIGRFIGNAINHLVKLARIVAGAIVKLLYGIIDAAADTIINGVEPLTMALMNLLSALKYAFGQALIIMIEGFARDIPFVGDALGDEIEKVRKKLKDDYEKPFDMSLYFEDSLADGSSVSESASGAGGQWDRSFAQGMEDNKGVVQDAANGLFDFSSNPLDSLADKWVYGEDSPIGKMPEMLKDKMSTDFSGMDLSGTTDIFNGKMFDGLLDTEGYGNVQDKNIDAYLNKLTDRGSEGYDSGFGFSGEVLNGVDGNTDGMKTLAGNYSAGFVNELDARGDEGEGGGYRYGSRVITGTAKALKSHSPSREAAKLGDYYHQGFFGSLMGHVSDIMAAGEGYGQSAIDGLKDAMTNVASAVDSDVAIDPTITPVVDLSNVQSASDSIDQMMEAQRATAMSMTIQNQANLQRQEAYQNTMLGRLAQLEQSLVLFDSRLVQQADILSNILGACGNQQIVLDSGALVGGIAAKMDDELGYRAQRAGRW